MRNAVGVWCDNGWWILCESEDPSLRSCQRGFGPSDWLLLGAAPALHIPKVLILEL